VGIRHTRPEKYGVNQCVGDTIGPGGSFVACGTWRSSTASHRTWQTSARRPGPAVLNPMAILTWRLALAGLRVVGLCHSVQGTARLLAGYCDVPVEELNYWVAGINHQAWFLTLEHDGKDLYPGYVPLLGSRRSSTWNRAVRAHAPVRLFRYRVERPRLRVRPYFRKRPELLAALVEAFEADGTEYSAWFDYGRTGAV